MQPPKQIVEEVQQVEEVKQEVQQVEEVKQEEVVLNDLPIFSLADAISKSAEKAHTQTPSQKQAEESTLPTQPAPIDENAENKIKSRKIDIVQAIAKQRVRYTPFFEVMKVNQNSIIIDVPTADIAEDMKRVWADIAPQIVQTLGITSIELITEVKEEMKVARPIKLDDRAKHFAKLNPNLEKLVEKLEMIIES